MIDNISLQILKILQKKARIPNVEVARQVKMAPSAVLERIRKLEKQGYIDGYEVRLNPTRFSKGLIAFITLELDKTIHYSHIGQSLSRIAEVQEVHYIAGEDGYLIKVRVSDPKELGEFIQEKILTIKSVKTTKSNIVMSTFKETAQIPIEGALK